MFERGTGGRQFATRIALNLSAKDCRSDEVVPPTPWADVRPGAPGVEPPIAAGHAGGAGSGAGGAGAGAGCDGAGAGAEDPELEDPAPDDPEPVELAAPDPDEPADPDRVPLDPDDVTPLSEASAPGSEASPASPRPASDPSTPWASFDLPELSMSSFNVDVASAEFGAGVTTATGDEEPEVPTPCSFAVTPAAPPTSGTLTTRSIASPTLADAT